MPAKESVISRIMAIKGLATKELIEKYAELFQGQISPTNNRIYLWKRIAFRIQELEYGGLSGDVQSKLQALIKEFDPINHVAKSTQVETPKKKDGRDRRLPIPGTILMKDYKGVKHEVKVLEKGFEFKNKSYKSLSAITKEITGAHWNGYLFFGL
jgi:hypothetical protein